MTVSDSSLFSRRSWEMVRSRSSSVALRRLTCAFAAASCSAVGSTIVSREQRLGGKGFASCSALCNRWRDVTLRVMR